MKTKIFVLLKRLFDLVFSLGLLFVLSPVLLAIGLAIKLESRGPILYQQERIGVNGKEFTIFKFRTMYCDAREQSIPAAFILRSDPRITRVGRFLRRTFIDEFPQLFSVLKGDQSIVGPRPAMPYEVKHYTIEQRQRLVFKPGLTGYWQVYGQELGRFDLEEMIKMDLEYIKIHSFLLDIKIIAKTVAMMLRTLVHIYV